MDDIETTQTTTETEADSTQDSAAETQDSAAETQGETTPEVDIVALVKQNKELGGAVKRLQAQLYGDRDNEPPMKRETTREQPERKVTTAQESRLEDLEVDEDTGLVNYKGTLVSGEFAQDLLDLRAGQDRAAEEKTNAEKRALANEIESHISDGIVSAREQRFPTLKGKSAELADGLLVPGVLGELAARIEGPNGERLTDDLIASVMTERFTAFAELFGAMGQAQADSNRQYAARNPVKPGGQPALKVAKSIDDMTRAERAAASAAARRAVEAAGPSG
jgi:hypothetical protein